MNIVAIIGRQTKETDVRYTADNKAIARYTLAVDRRGEGADFISCVSFGKTAEFIGKYGAKGKKWAVVGRIQTGSYEKDGKTVYTTDVIVDTLEFGDSKQAEKNEPAPAGNSDDFMKIPDGIDSELPFV